LSFAIGFCLVFMVVEVIFGIESHSLALVTDAMHLLTDVAALSLSLFATVVSEWAGSKRLSFGWHRAEVVGAMASVFLVWVLVGVIVYEACVRIKNIVHCAQSGATPCDECEAIEGMTMLIVGCAGFCVNVCTAMILMLGGHAHSHGGLPGGSGACSGHDHGGASHHDDHHEAPAAREGTPLLQSASTARSPKAASARTAAPSPRDHGHSHGGGSEANMNVRGAMIHAIGDCIQSIAVVIAAAIIWGVSGPKGNAYSWYNLADPICSLIFALLTLYTTRFLTVDVFFVLMEATPESVSLQELHDQLEEIDGVELVDHLHCWALTPSLKSLSVHLVVPDLLKHPMALRRAKAIAKSYGVDHSTIQVDVLSEDMEVGASPLCVSFKRTETQSVATQMSPGGSTTAVTIRQRTHVEQTAVLGSPPPRRR
jgi:zinc transporter 2